jgi:hypothetical protein
MEKLKMLAAAPAFRLGGHGGAGERSIRSGQRAICCKAGVDIASFGKHQRKDEITQQHLSRFEGDQGILYIGRAQEKAWLVRTERRRGARTGMGHPWLVDGSAKVSHDHFCRVDGDFGPFFLPFSSYRGTRLR